MARRPNAGRRSRAPPAPPGRRPAARRRARRRSRHAPRSWRSILPCRPSSLTWPASAALRPRSSSAVGRSWRASIRSSSIAWLASALVSASSCASSTGALTRAASSRSRRAVSDWLTSSWRSRATRARSSSWAASAALEVRRRSASRRSSMRRKRDAGAWPPPRDRPGRPPAERRLARGRERSARSISSTSLSRGRNRRWSMNTLTRIVSATASAKHQRQLRTLAEVEAGVAGDPRRDHRGDHQQQVGHQHLGQKVLAAHLHRSIGRREAILE